MLSFHELSLDQRRHSFSLRSSEWKLYDALLINSSEDIIHKLTFFPFCSFPPRSPSVSPPHTLAVTQSLINSSVLSRRLKLSRSLTHTLGLVVALFSVYLLLSTSLLKHAHACILTILSCNPSFLISLHFSCPSALKRARLWWSFFKVFVSSDH